MTLSLTHSLTLPGLTLYITYVKWSNRDRQPRLDCHLLSADIGSLFLCTARFSWSTQPRGSLPSIGSLTVLWALQRKFSNKKKIRWQNANNSFPIRHLEAYWLFLWWTRQLFWQLFWQFSFNFRGKSGSHVLEIFLKIAQRDLVENNVHLSRRKANRETTLIYRESKKIPWISTTTEDKGTSAQLKCLY